MARSHAGGWTARELLIVIVTAGATALFTAGAQYIATVKVENDKVRSSSIVKIADDFQMNFSSLMSALRQFTNAAEMNTKIPEKERDELANTILAMQLLFAPTTGRWPDAVSLQADSFFKDLSELEKTIRNARTLSDLGPLEKNTRILVVDDMEIIRAMQTAAQLNYLAN